MQTLMVIHTLQSDLLLKAFKRLFQSLTYLEELLFIWCLAEGKKVLWPAREGDSGSFYGSGEVDEDRGSVLTMVIR